MLDEKRIVRVLGELEKGMLLQPQGEDWRLGRSRIGEQAVVHMRARDLVEPAPGGYRISGPGRAFVARARAGTDGAYCQNRLIAEETRRIDGKDARYTVNRAEAPLAWLARRGLLSAAQVEAGERLRSDFEMAQLGPRVTMAWDSAPAQSGHRGPPEPLTRSESQIAAKRRVKLAMSTAGPGLSDVLWRVVCSAEGLETAEKALAWPPRSAKLVLGMALDRLIAHYAQKSTK